MSEPKILPCVEGGAGECRNEDAIDELRESLAAQTARAEAAEREYGKAAALAYASIDYLPKDLTGGELRTQAEKKWAEIKVLTDERDEYKYQRDQWITDCVAAESARDAALSRVVALMATASLTVQAFDEMPKASVGVVSARIYTTQMRDALDGLRAALASPAPDYANAIAAARAMRDARANAEMSGSRADGIALIVAEQALFDALAALDALEVK